MGDIKIDQARLDAIGQAVWNAWAGICRSGIDCDMCLCDKEILSPRYTVVNLRDHDFALCAGCWEKLAPSLAFLTIAVGIDIPFTVHDQKCGDD